MRKRVLLFLALAIFLAAGLPAQQMPSQTLTLVTDFTVRPGMEGEFMKLVELIGAPVRDKLMAEGVVLGWGLDVPVLRMPGQPTHSIWVSVADWEGIGKVQAGMAAQLAKLAADDAAAADEARRRRTQLPKPTAERISETIDDSKTRSWVFRDVMATYGTPPAGALPYSRIFTVKVKADRTNEWRAMVDQYYKPVLDRMTQDGTISAWGLGIEEVKTAGEFTHFFWVSYPSMAALDSARTAIIAHFGRLSPVEGEQVAKRFAEMTDPDAARSFILRAVIFKVPSR